MFKEIWNINQILYYYDDSSIAIKVTPDFYNNTTMQIKRSGSFSLCVKIT